MSENKTNGKERHREFLVDPDDPAYIKDLQRPAVIKEDLSEMERRKRVHQILESKSFCKELEEVIRQECESARSDPDHLQTLQRLSDLTVSQTAMPFANLHTSAGIAIPIADVGGSEKFAKQERMQRNKLASLFRIADLFQWSQGICNDISLRLSEAPDQFLTNPFGLLYHEVTAGSLVKVDGMGNVVDAGTTKLGINMAGFALHAAIHKARPDVKCVLHMHTAVVAAVASMKCGLLALCQEAMTLGPVAYHDYLEIGDDESASDNVVNALGDKNVMLLRNRGFLVVGDSVEHTMFLAQNTVVACETQVLLMRGDGFVVVGETLEEAVYLMRNAITACDHQVRAARAGIENLVIPDKKSIERAFESSKLGVTNSALRRTSSNGVQWKVGELEWEAWMRVLDHAGYRTGHVYRQPMMRPKSAMAQITARNKEVATPPSSSAIGMVDESDSETLAAYKLALMRKEQERVRWLNSPNAYQKVEILESGTDRPKKITKWVQDPSSPSVSGTPVKINGVHHFSPVSQNPKEFKEKQKAIKENRRIGTTSAGPQSQILDGVTYEDFSLIVKADNEGLVGQSNAEDRAIFIGTASKGIIDRQYQHNAQVYKQLYAPNPFSAETDADLKKYIQEVESKSPKARTPRTPAKIDKYHRSDSPFDDCPDADTASLMQGVREHQMSTAARSGSTDSAFVSPTNVECSRESMEKSFSTRVEDLDCPSTCSSTRTTSPEHRVVKARRRFTVVRVLEPGLETSRSNSSKLETESPKDEKKKKKKKGFFAFIRRKDKSAA